MLIDKYGGKNQTDRTNSTRSAWAPVDGSRERQDNRGENARPCCFFFILYQVFVTEDHDRAGDYGDALPEGFLFLLL